MSTAGDLKFPGPFINFFHGIQHSIIHPNINVGLLSGPYSLFKASMVYKDIFLYEMVQQGHWAGTVELNVEQFAHLQEVAPPGKSYG